MQPRLDDGQTIGQVMIRDEECSNEAPKIRASMRRASELTKKSSHGEVKNVSIQITERGIDDFDDQRTASVANSIELRRQRIASGNFSNKVKFKMQPYHQKVCSNQNI